MEKKKNNRTFKEKLFLNNVRRYLEIYEEKCDDLDELECETVDNRVVMTLKSIEKNKNQCPKTCSVYEVPRYIVGTLVVDQKKNDLIELEHVGYPDREIAPIQVMTQTLCEYEFSLPEKRELVNKEEKYVKQIVEMHDGMVFDLVWDSREDNIDKKPFHYRRSRLIDRDMVQEVSGALNKLYVLDSKGYGEGYFKKIMDSIIVLKPEIVTDRKGLMVPQLEYKMCVDFTHASGRDLYRVTTSKRPFKSEYTVKRIGGELVFTYLKDSLLPVSTYEEYLSVIEPRIVGVKMHQMGFYFYKDMRFKGKVVGVGFRRRLYDILVYNQMYGVIRNDGDEVVLRLYSERYAMMDISLPEHEVEKIGREHVYVTPYPRIE